jgi:oligoendopeptidase F
MNSITKEFLRTGYESLLQFPISSLNDFLTWLRDRATFEAQIEEESGWRYIKTTTHTNDQDAQKAFEEFSTEWYPIIAEKAHELNQKMLECPFIEQLNEPGFHRYLHDIQKQVQLFREENIPIETELRMLGNEYGNIMGTLQVEHQGQTLTLQQAAKLLKENDRALRESIYRKIGAARLEKRDQLNQLLSKMIRLRHQMALNAGFPNYLEYKFVELGRTDYTPADCLQFHQAVEVAIVPINRSFIQIRKDQLKLESLKPWDLKVDPLGRTPLSPFKTATELIEKSKQLFRRLDSSMADWLQTMENQHRLDLESRANKAPGGYQYPLPHSGIPFIFMNATGTMADLSTMVHEMGHAVHTQLANPLPTIYQNPPMEVAELASMSMELVTMDLWDEFFGKEDLLRAKEDQLQDAIGMLPWIAQVDAFQHWLYLNPEHTSEEREAHWQSLNDRFGTRMVDYTGFEILQKISWQGQLHIYEVPFYYIEYGFAQLGAIALWRNYLSNPTQCLENYKKALALGNTESIPNVYEIAGISFNFSPEYLEELASFVSQEFKKIHA